MRDLQSATEDITTAFEDPDFQKEVASARYDFTKIIFLALKC